ncbi:DNA helicase PIF1, ATP-dependent [Corchorus olitorius]|uniref:ATP-dependent DNA helicase n=1 Tax=Corchorus olitorius TaxID=93759 RepID=A0A1R3J5Z8_9ROSI|nr:DNA helicase PIF1, ATP-dependent [Corchorus olitorius]
MARPRLADQPVIATPVVPPVQATMNRRRRTSIINNALTTTAIIPTLNHGILPNTNQAGALQTTQMIQEQVPHATTNMPDGEWFQRRIFHAYEHGSSSNTQGPTETRTIDGLREEDSMQRKIFQVDSFGGPDMECHNCGAQMWSKEHVQTSTRSPHLAFTLCCKQDRETDDRTYCTPTSTDIAGLIVDGVADVEGQRDIIVNHRKYGLQRISNLHPLYMSLQYLLLFPYGEDGFRLGICYVDCPQENELKRKTVTMREYYSYMIQQRQPKSSSLLRGGRLFQQYLIDAASNALAICQYHGFPDLFITFTCNAYWIEIQEALLPGQRAENRPDIVCRVFKLKLDDLLDDLMKHYHFSPLKADQYISAEIPDHALDPSGYDAVTTFMFHGPCGVVNPKAQYMKDGKCNKFFPKPFQPETKLDESGFHLYRRRDTCISFKKNGIELDNRFIVPHNIDMCVKYQAHINVEVCNHGRTLKYLFKYITKGPDKARVVIEKPQGQSETQPQQSQPIHNEIKTYLDARYLCPYEPIWTIFAFQIHHREPTVIKLPIHLPNQHIVCFRDTQRLDRFMRRRDIHTTMFTEWMVANAKYQHARSLLYADFPTHFVWDSDALVWGQPHMRNFEQSMVFSSLLYFPRGMRCPRIDRCVISQNQIFNNIEFSIFFPITNPAVLFEQNWQIFSDDILHRFRNNLRAPYFMIPPEQLRDYVLLEIEDLLSKNCSSLADKNLPQPSMRTSISSMNRLIQEERCYDHQQLQLEHEQMLAKLNTDQRQVYEVIIQSVLREEGRLFFVNGYRGTGKTFLWKTLISGLRCNGKIVLAVASSGIASLVLPGGRTAHSRFKIPFNPDEWSTCQMYKDTASCAWRNKITDSRCKHIKLQNLAKLHKSHTDNKHAPDIGNGTVPHALPEDDSEGTWIRVPQNLMVHSNEEPLQAITEEIYPDIKNYFAHSSYIKQRAIVTPFNDTVEDLNNYIMNKIPVDSRIYLSSNSIAKNSSAFHDQNTLYPPEILSKVTVPGIPNQKLELKIGCAVMIMGNINQVNGLCNGTRLIITQLATSVIEGYQTRLNYAPLLLIIKVSMEPVVDSK